MSDAERVIAEAEEFIKRVRAANELASKMAPHFAKAMSEQLDDEVLKILQDCQPIQLAPPAK